MGILLAVLVFVLWELGFTTIGIWKYPRPLSSAFRLGAIPIETIVFLFLKAYLSILLYMFTPQLIRRNLLRNWHFSITPIAIIFLVLLLINNFEKTMTAMVSAFLMLLFCIQLIKLKRYMGRFFKTLLISVLPLYVFNLLLLDAKLIVYNPSGILGLTLGIVPVECFLYDAAFLLLAVMGYEWLKRKVDRKAPEINPGQ